MKQRNQDIQELEDIAMIAKKAYINTGVLAEQMLKEKKRTDDLTAATFETLSRRQRPVFVKELRKQGYSQEEVGKMVNRSQSSIHNYEKIYNKQNSK